MKRITPLSCYPFFKLKSHKTTSIMCRSKTNLIRTDLLNLYKTETGHLDHHWRPQEPELSRTHRAWIYGDFLVLQSPESIPNLFIIDCVWGNNCLIADVYGCIIYKQSVEDVTINKFLQWPMRILMMRQPSSGNNKLHRNTNNNYNYWIVTVQAALPFEPLPF